MIRLLRCYVAAIVTVLSGCAVLDPHNIIGRHQAPPPASDFPLTLAHEHWKRDALDVVWTSINEKYYDAKLNGVDWPAARKKYEPLLAAARDDDEFWEQLDRMTGELRDAHTRVESPKQVAQRRDDEAHSHGISFLELDGKLVLTGVNTESDAWWAGARAGMTIQRIDGEPALALYRHLIDAARGSSTPWARTRAAARKINAGDVGSKTEMVFQRADGSEIIASLARRKFRAAAEASHRVLPSGFGYIRFSGFERSLQSGIVAAIDELKGTTGMIIDLRNNGGGSGDMAAALMARFFEKDQRGVRILTRSGKPVSLLFVDVVKLEPELKGVGKLAYTRPLVVLTNRNSASASEVFAGTLQDSGRATIIGQRSCGCLLGFLGYADLPGGGQLAYSEIGFVTSKGQRIEGEGVNPDVEVKLTQDDILFNRDRSLEMAEAFLKEKTFVK